MPEIRLGSNENLPDIKLGSVQIEEVRLGSVLVWQNNQGPVYLSLTWDGTSFNAPVPFEAFTGAAISRAATQAGARSISLLVTGLSDLDNLMGMPVVDFIVGYRLQRPDGTWASGDPSSTANNSNGSPIADFGASLPGLVSVYNSVSGEFSSGASTGNSTIPVTLRETDSVGTVVTTQAQQFVDDGNWELFVVDSRGGQSSMGTISVTLNYDAPDQTIDSTTTGAGNLGAVQNNTIGGPSAITLRANPLATAGPGVNYVWQCTGNCTGTTTGTGLTVPNVNVPQAAGGNATVATWTVTATGRAWNGNAALTGSTSVGVRSGVSCSPSYTVNTSNYSLNNACATFGGVPTGSATISCSGSGCSFTSVTGNVNSGSFSSPNPGCTGFNTLEAATVSVSGGILIGGSTIGSGGSRTFRGSYPQVQSTCRVSVTCNNAPSALGAECGTIQTVNLGCAGTTCAGGTATTPCNGPVLTIANNNPANYRGGGVSGGSACSGPGGTSTISVNYSAIQPTWGITCASSTVPAGTLPGTAAPIAAGCTAGINNGVSINGSFNTSVVTISSGGINRPCIPGDTFNVVAGTNGANPCTATFFQGGCSVQPSGTQPILTCV